MAIIEFLNVCDQTCEWIKGNRSKKKETWCYDAHVEDKGELYLVAKKTQKHFILFCLEDCKWVLGSFELPGKWKATTKILLVKNVFWMIKVNSHLIMIQKLLNIEFPWDQEYFSETYSFLFIGIGMLYFILTKS